MITKRHAVVAMFSAILAKMAHADEPPKPSSVFQGAGTPLFLMQPPTGWFVNLDMVTTITVTMNGEKIDIPAAEIFAALKGPIP